MTQMAQCAIRELLAISFPGSQLLLCKLFESAQLLKLNKPNPTNDPFSFM